MLTAYISGATQDMSFEAQMSQKGGKWRHVEKKPERPNIINSFQVIIICHKTLFTVNPEWKPADDSDEQQKKMSTSIGGVFNSFSAYDWLGNHLTHRKLTEWMETDVRKIDRWPLRHSESVMASCSRLSPVLPGYRGSNGCIGLISQVCRSYDEKRKQGKKCVECRLLNVPSLLHSCVCGVPRANYTNVIVNALTMWLYNMCLCAFNIVLFDFIMEYMEPPQLQ